MKKAFCIPLLVCLVAAAIGLVVFPYRPPLLDRGSRNPKEWLFDHILFVWYYSRAVWLESVEGEEAALPTRARAVWHHPEQSEAFFGISLEDYRALAGLYESLGLFEQAAQLVEHGFLRGAPSPERARQAILSCAGLSAWEEVERIAGWAASPDFPEGSYWLGRALVELEGRYPHEAEIALIKAGNNMPGSADIYYHLGRIYRRMGDYKHAAESFRRSVESSPLHQKAWAALADIREERGQKQAAAEAAEIAAGLLPPLRARGRFGNELIFLGSSLIPPEIRGGDEVTLTLYYRVLPGADRDLRPLIMLRSPRSGKAVHLAPVPLPGSPGEEYLVAPVEVRVPQEIWPGETEVSIAFLDPEGRPLRIFGERAYELSLSLTTTHPRVFRDYPGDSRLKEIFGEEVIDLGVRTVLSGRSAVTIQPDSETEVSGIGLVSSTLDTVPLPAGTEVARMECRGTDGSSYIFPVRLGRETADAYLAKWPSNITGHSPAEIFSSEVKSSGGLQFSAHDYRTKFLFPCPVRLAEVRLVYDYPERGGWLIKRFCLIP